MKTYTALTSEFTTTKTSFMDNVASVFSSIMEEPVSTRQARCIINAIFALIATIFPAPLPFALRAVAIAWLWTALRKCRKAGLKEE